MIVIKNKQKENEMEKYKCCECGKELTENYFYCYYSGDCEENRVCGEGDCWADWIQWNMEEVEIEKEEE